MTALLTSFLSIFAKPLLEILLRVATNWYEAIQQREAKERQDRAGKAVQDGDNIALEKEMGHSDAGAPSGIGKLRPKEKVSSPDVDGRQP
jgi:hypothetical protein